MTNDGGISGRAVSRLLGLAGALGLAACGGDELPVAGPDTPTGCPDVRIVEDLATVTAFRAGPGRDLTDVVARAGIADFSGQCEYGETGVTVDLNLILGAERGPAAATDRADLVYFVAVADPQGTILAKEVFETGVVFEGGATRAGVQEELRQIIPLDRLGDGPFHQILVGFQLTPEQVEFNRR